MNVRIHSLQHNAACQVMHVLRSKPARLQTAAQPQKRPTAAGTHAPHAVLLAKPSDMRFACGHLRCPLQVLQLVDKAKDGSVAITDLMPVRFVPLVPEKQNREL